MGAGRVDGQEEVGMSNKKVLVLGGNFAGLTAAISVKHELGNDVDVSVVSKSDRFQFNPSFIWIPFGKRKAKDVVFPVAKTFESRGVELSTARRRRSIRRRRRLRPPTASTRSTTW
jgi:NADH dehydrogenase FAD-containing subunit